MAVSFRQDTNKPKVIPYFPTKSYGKEGDIVISKISGRGVFLCIKASGIWYSQTSMQPLQKINTSYIKNLSSDKMTIKNLQNSKINTDKFIISENGDIKYRTANQILSDLGLEGINSFDIDYKTAYCSLQQYSDKETCEANGGTWYYSENDSHDNVSSTAENQLLTVSQSIGNVDAEPTLLYDGSTLNIKHNSNYDDNWQTSAQTDLLKLSHGSKDVSLNVTSIGSLTIDAPRHITLDADGGNVYIHDAGDSHFLFSCSGTSMTIYDDTSADDYLKFQVNTNGASTISTNDNDGAAGHLTLDADGSTIINIADGSEASSFHVSVDGATNRMCSIFGAADDQSIFRMYEMGGSSLVDYLEINVAEHGETVISTVDASAAAASLTLQPDGPITLDASGDITLDASGADVHIAKSGTTFGSLNTGTLGNLKLIGATNISVTLESQGSGDVKLVSSDDIVIDATDALSIDTDGNFAMKKDGTEYSVANSAYAGMILGYRMIGEDNIHESYTMTTSYAVPDADMTVRFVAPPSGCVEVMVQIHANASSSNRIIYFGLSDNATYNSIGNSYEQMHRMPDETDDEVCQHYWTITGLTAGSTYNYWFGAKTSLTNAFLNWGGTSANRYADFIMKVTALPAATSDFAEYD